MRKTECIAVLTSGGLDSACLIGRLLEAGNSVLPLYIRCGFIWESAELHWLQRFLSEVKSPKLHRLKVLDVPLRSTYGDHWSLTGRKVPGKRSSDQAVYLPGRNVVLVLHAAVVCSRLGVKRIALGTLKGNPFGDATSAFRHRFQRCLSAALNRSMRIVAPLARLSKNRLLEQTRSVPIELTFSCLRPRGNQHCGRCNKCAERKRAFRRSRIADPTHYAN